jgi:3D (Asp-Asp-Asp) domain-containing protein
MTTIKKAVAAGALIVALEVGGGIGQARAQESSGTTKTSEQELSKLVEAYRLDFSIHELEDGKKINTRQYSMNLTASEPEDIKIGSRVPVESKQGEFQYLDVGTNISGRLHSHNGQLELFVRVEMSNFAIPEQASGHEPHPVIRQLKIGGSTLVVVGKPMVLGIVDDPNSKRQFQLEVTMTKLR